MMGWRDSCDSTIRVAAQFLSRGEPSLTAELNQLSQAVVLGTKTPMQAAEQLQKGLEGWYEPQQKVGSAVVPACGVVSGLSGAVSTSLGAEPSAAGATTEAMQAVEAELLKESASAAKPAQ